MSHADPIVLTGDSDGEAEQMEAVGASSGFLYVFTFASSTRGARARGSNHVCSFIFFSTVKILFSCLSLWLLPDRTRAQRARENDGESTETWRVIDSGANERSRFVFSRSLLSRLASVWFCIFSSPCPLVLFLANSELDFKKSHRQHKNKPKM